MFGDIIKRYYAPEDCICIGKEISPVNTMGDRIIHLGVMGETLVCCGLLLLRLRLRLLRVLSLCLCVRMSAGGENVGSACVLAFAPDV